jgi:chromosome segregation ATPase
LPPRSPGQPARSAAAWLEKESQDLAGKIASRGNEITATQQQIEQVVQAIAALDEVARSLAKPLATLPNDAELMSAQTAAAAARTAKQSQLEAKQQQMAALTAERESWEKLVAEKKATVEKHRQEMATATAAMNDAAKQAEAAAPAVEAAAKDVAAKQAAAAERQTQLTAVSLELDGLQGIKD